MENGESRDELIVWLHALFVWKSIFDLTFGFIDCDVANDRVD
jgi:hypothetical protein